MERKRLYERIRNLQFVSGKLVEGLLSGNYRTVFKGPGLEFDEVREYVDGDDARMIDWNVSSRMPTPYVKTFKEERELTLFLLIDVSASLNSGTGPVSKAEISAMVAALLSFAAVQNNDKVGAVFFSDRIEKWVPPIKGRKHVMRLVEDMETIAPKGRGSDLSLAVRTVYESLKRRGICVLLSDFRMRYAWQEISLLSRKHDVIAVKVIDPSMVSFPPIGYLEVVDPETGDVISVNGRSKKFAEQYGEFWETRHILWQRSCRRRKIDTLTISTEEDPVEALFRFFARRRKR
jgi:uncharacterized protein (DUF58 family)